MQFTNEDLRIISLALKDLHISLNRKADKWNCALLGNNIFQECADKTYTLINRVDYELDELIIVPQSPKQALK